MITGEYLQEFTEGEDSQELVEGVFPHLPGGEGEHRGEVGDQTKEAKQAKKNSLAPELKLLPNLECENIFLNFSRIAKL